MFAETSILLFERVAASAFIKALPYMLIGLIAIAFLMFVYPRVANRLSAIAREIVLGGTTLVMVGMFIWIAEVSSWLWALIYAAIVAIWFGVAWMNEDSRKKMEAYRATLPKCPYCKSTRIAIVPNVTTATCLNCGHILHIERR